MKRRAVLKFSKGDETISCSLEPMIEGKLPIKHEDGKGIFFVKDCEIIIRY